MFVRFLYLTVTNTSFLHTENCIVHGHVLDVGEIPGWNSEIKGGSWGKQKSHASGMFLSCLGGYILPS